MPSQAERRTTTRGAIIAAARELFGANSFAQVTMDDVAARAGVTKGGLYHHFESKEALFTGVLIAEQEALLALVSAGSGGDVLNQFAEAVRRYLAGAVAPPTRQILLIDGPAVLGYARWRDIDERLFGQMVRQAVRLLRGGGVADAEVEILAKLIIGALMEGAMICATSADPEQAARHVATALRALLAGLER